jgi:hypothetical protein
MSPRPWEDPHVQIVMLGLPKGWSVVLPYTPTAMTAIGRHLEGLIEVGAGTHRPAGPVVVGAVVMRRDAPPFRQNDKRPELDVS